LEPRVPNAKIVVSALRTSVMTQLRRELPGTVSKIYLPLDRRAWVVRALASLNPQVLILAGIDLWPNFLWRARERGTPTILFPGCLSPADYRKYHRFPSIFGRLLRGLDAVGARSENEARLLKELGCRSGNVRLTGDLRFDASATVEQKTSDVPAFLAQVGVEENRAILLASGVDSADSSVIIRAYTRLRKRFPSLFLVLAPAAFERTREISHELRRAGLHYVYRSDVPRHGHHESIPDCVVLDTPSDLGRWCECASLVFLGTFNSGSGQDPAEPAAAEKTIILGARMGDYTAMARELTERKGALQLKAAAELEPALAKLLENEALRSELGKNAKAVVLENQGAFESAIDLIVANLDSELYVSPRK
jgi:3-deoxy-D-manno-octulosonic-acid transferase